MHLLASALKKMIALTASVASLALFPGLAKAELSPLSAEEMHEVTGQEGIAFEFDIRYNSDAAGNINTTICPAGNRVQCRMAIKYANRNDGGGEWLTLKGLSGRMFLPRFNLNATRAPVSASPYADTGRFISGTGAPVSPYGKPNLKLSFVEPILMYQYKIAGMAIEYGAGNVTGTTAGLPSGDGFLADPTDSRSFIGLLISNSIAGQPGSVQVDGDIRIFGF